MLRTPPSLVLMLALGLACAPHGSQTVPVALAPCAVPGVGSADSPWRQVRASGFTFCIPGGWRPSGHGRDSTDAKLWNGGGGSVSWDLGRPGTLAQGAVMTVTGTIVTSVTPTPNAPTPLPSDGSSQPCTQPTNAPLMIGGVALMVTQVDCQGTWTTTAWSMAPENLRPGPGTHAKAGGAAPLGAPDNPVHPVGRFARPYPLSPRATGRPVAALRALPHPDPLRSPPAVPPVPPAPPAAGRATAPATAL